MPRFGKEEEQELSIITPVLRTYRFHLPSHEPYALQRDELVRVGESTRLASNLVGLSPDVLVF